MKLDKTAALLLCVALHQSACADESTTTRFRWHSVGQLEVDGGASGLAVDGNTAAAATPLGVQFFEYRNGSWERTAGPLGPTNMYRIVLRGSIAAATHFGEELAVFQKGIDGEWVETGAASSGQVHDFLSLDESTLAVSDYTGRTTFLEEREDGWVPVTTLNHQYSGGIERSAVRTEKGTGLLFQGVPYELSGSDTGWSAEPMDIDVAGAFVGLDISGSVAVVAFSEQVWFLKSTPDGRWSVEASLASSLSGGNYLNSLDMSDDVALVLGPHDAALSTFHRVDGSWRQGEVIDYSVEGADVGISSFAVSGNRALVSVSTYFPGMGPPERAVYLLERTAAE